MAVLVLDTGCQSTNSARSKQRFHPVSGNFTDLDARSTYVTGRVAELTDKGLKPEAAAARASREWFSRASVARSIPTRYELQRREAQGQLTAFLDQRQKSENR